MYPSGWTFFTQSDPTNGLVDFVSQDEATSSNLAFVQSDGTAVMGVDDTTKLSDGQNRKSVRIQSTKSYDSGLFIADIYSMPHGCSVWPAWWMVGPNWPSGGEIDIIEGVNLNTVNQYTLHTSTGCTLDTSPAAHLVNNATGKVQAFTSKVLGTQCASGPSNNNGCAFLESSTTTYGHGFNELAGGVYATLVDSTGVSIWHFDRSSIPQDIDSKSPDPTTWGSPNAFWSASTCNVGSHFNNLQMVFDITLCGDWAGASFNGDGCSGSCSALVADPTNYELAKWKVNYVAVYQ